jgi:toll-like receptor 13
MITIKLTPQVTDKLCIPHRDFELGKVFADNIVDHMNLSKTVIPVLSNNFARNEWCLFQLAVARNKITKAGNLSIFPIMLDEIIAHTTTLNYILKQN